MNTVTENTPTITENAWSKEMEKSIYTNWKEHNVYAFEDNDKPIYSIDTPPPYVNSPIHIGHAATYSMMDMFARFKRMKGFRVIFPLGLDRNGLPIEVAAEKKFGKKLTQTPRNEFIELCKKVLEESSSATIDSFLKLGISFTSWKEGGKPGDVYLTDSPDFRALTQATFIDLWNKGKIVEEKRINNFCTSCQTTLADSEIDYKESAGTFNHIIFTVKETGEHIHIATTRPELIGACGMVIFHPDDPRYTHLQGKTAITPVYNKEVPLRADPAAKMEKGTGIVMMCSAGDVADIRFFREHKLTPTILIEKDGRMNASAGLLEGLYVNQARKKIIELLQQQKLLVKQEQVTHEVPACERCKSNIEFIEMSELYVQQLHDKEHVRTISEELRFFNESSRQILNNWIDSIAIDWPISRRRYYATEIPLWYCEDCSNVIVPPKGKYYQPWKEQPPIKHCPQCNGTQFKGEERVLDTWFDSSNTPLYILRYGTSFFNKAFPATLRPQGREIIRTWLYYTLLKNYHLNENLIFRDVWINYHIVDEHGHKMSKSKGNGIDPQEVITKFGAEPFRLWVATEGNITQGDLRCSFDRISGAGKTLAKLWNVARFISSFPKPEPAEVTEELDKWILAELNDLVLFAEKQYEQYDFYTPSLKIRNFLWETFASHYVELVKRRAYNEGGHFTKEQEISGRLTLHFCVETLLKLWAPVIPMITDSLYTKLTGNKVHTEHFPRTLEAGKRAAWTTDHLVSLNAFVWKAKKEAGKSLKHPVKKIVIHPLLKSVEQDIKLAHGIEVIEYGEEQRIELV